MLQARAIVASAANGTLVGVFRSVIVPADGHQRCQLERAGISARRRFLGSSRASTDLPVPLYVWCHDQSTMVRREFNSQFKRGCRCVGCTPMMTVPVLTLQRKLRHFAI